MSRPRTAVLLSGGVDSSVALHLLAAGGEHRLTAFYLKIWLEDELSFLGQCPWQDDLHFARRVCRQAGVPLEVVSLQRQYHDVVVRWALSELRAGRTPSPDVLCNQRIKFGAFLDLLDDTFGADAFDHVATGHYARVDRAQDGSVRLLSGVDPVKDQTYFLHQLDQHQLGRCLFPVGHLPKRQVRQIASDLGLANRDRPDSQGICFLGKIRYDDFVRSHLGERGGAIRHSVTGERLGEHRGHWFFTLGQRKGLGLGGGPWYVVSKDVGSNEVLVVHQRDLRHHAGRRFQVPDVHWIRRPPGTRRLEARVRHGPTTTGAEIRPLAAAGLEVRLDRSDPGLAPGQSAVFYNGDECVGGGQIHLVSGKTPQAPAEMV